MLGLSTGFLANLLLIYVSICWLLISSKLEFASEPTVSPILRNTYLCTKEKQDDNCSLGLLKLLSNSLIDLLIKFFIISITLLKDLLINSLN